MSLDGWLRALARGIYRFPLVVLLVSLVTALACLGLTVSRLHFSTDRTDLLDPDQDVQRTWRAFTQEFGKTADFVVLFHGDFASRQAAVEELATRLKAEPQYFDNVFYRLDLAGISKHALYFLSLADLQKMRQELQAARPWLKELASPDGMAAMLKKLARRQKPAELARELTPVLPLLNRILEQLALSLEARGSNVYESPLGDFQPEAAPVPGRVVPGQTRFYTQLGDGSAHMLVVRAADRSGSFKVDVATLNRLRDLISSVARSHLDVSIHLSGEPVINTDEMQGASRDAVRSAALAMVAVNLLLTVAFGQFLRPQMVVVSLLIGLAWSFGFAAATVGKLNLITVNFATILVGLGMTFGIHLLYRYAELRAAGQPALEGLEITLAEGGKENLVGALTTAIAFWALHFTSFRSAGELGLIAGTGVILCYLSMLTVLPALLMLQEKMSRRATQPGTPLAHMDDLGAVESWLHRHPRPILAVSLVFSLYCLTWIPYIPFDYNLLNMQDRNAEAIRVEGYLQKSGYSTLYALSIAPNAEEAVRRTAAFKRLATVSRIESVASLIPANAAEKEKLVDELAQLGRELKAPGLPPERRGQELLEMFESFKTMKVNVDEALPLIKSPASRELRRILDKLQEELNTMGPGAIQEGLAAFEHRLVDDLDVQLKLLQAQEKGQPDLLRELPETMRLRSIGPSGSVVLRIFPRGDAWEREPLERFIHQLQTVDPQITGTPVLIYFYLEELRHAYNVSGRNALLVISVLLLVHFRSFKRALLALFPKLLGIVWMLGVMGTLHVDFNAANFMALPLTLGIGLIFGVHVLQQSDRPNSLFTDCTGPAILLSGLTTIIGFACLLTADHRGVASLGLVMAIGVGTNLLTSLVVLPALLQFSRRPSGPESPPA